MPLRIDPINAASTVLIVVDMQNHFLVPGAPLESRAGRQMIPTLCRAIALCRERSMPVVYTRQLHREDGTDRRLSKHFWDCDAETDGLIDGAAGAEIHSELVPDDSDLVVVKSRYSAFYGTDLERRLRDMGINTVIIGGVTTENCCHATARDAFFRDFQVGFLADATATFDYPDTGHGGMSAAQVHRASLVILAASTADVMSTDDLVARTSGARPT
jgi:ureidoacrylate peracid hydrolase